MEILSNEDSNNPEDDADEVDECKKCKRYQKDVDRLKGKLRRVDELNTIKIKYDKTKNKLHAANKEVLEVKIALNEQKTIASEFQTNFNIARDNNLQKDFVINKMENDYAKIEKQLIDVTVREKNCQVTLESLRIDQKVKEIENSVMKQEMDDMRKTVNRLHNEIEDATICKVCMENPLDTLISPCNHLSVCGDCSNRVKNCPICRQHIYKTIRVYKA